MQWSLLSNFTKLERGELERKRVFERILGYGKNTEANKGTCSALLEEERREICIFFSGTNVHIIADATLRVSGGFSSGKADTDVPFEERCQGGSTHILRHCRLLFARSRFTYRVTERKMLVDLEKDVGIG